MRSGFVYVFSNPGLTAHKVGYSTRPLYIRAGELRREYGTLYPFQIESRHAVDDPAAVEALAHRILGHYRIPRSELFACDLATCQHAVMTAARAVLERPPLLRFWHWLTLPKPRRGGHWRHGRGGSAGELVALLLGIGILVALAYLKPDMPAWLPPGALRLVYLVERMR